MDCKSNNCFDNILSTNMFQNLNVQFGIKEMQYTLLAALVSSGIGNCLPARTIVSYKSTQHSEGGGYLSTVRGTGTCHF